MEFTLADRMNEFEEGIFQLLDQHKNKMLKEERKYIIFQLAHLILNHPADVMKAVSEAACHAENYKYSLYDRSFLIEALQQKYLKRYDVSLSEHEMMSVYGSQEELHI